MAEVLLKARPTAAQLADRLTAPLPDGLELYLDSEDLADEPAMRAAVERLEACRLPSDFTFIIEGPIRSLDGEFFHVARRSEADAEVVRRLVWMGERIGAAAINLHPIAPEGIQSLNQRRHREQIEASLRLLEPFAELAAAAGIVPTVENMPPVLRMRQGGFFFSAMGMSSEDLLELVERVSGLRICLDVSHAQLAVNAQGGARAADGAWPDLTAFLAGFQPLQSVSAMLERMSPYVFSAHISNASGIIGEGQAYGDGELDLDRLVRELSRHVQYLVTETLEPDPDHAVFMREAQRRMLAALGARGDA